MIDPERYINEWERVLYFIESVYSLQRNMLNFSEPIQTISQLRKRSEKFFSRKLKKQSTNTEVPLPCMIRSICNWRERDR